MVQLLRWRWSQGGLVPAGRLALPRMQGARCRAGQECRMTMERSATFSEDRSRRFELVRDWRDEIGAPQTTVLFGMLNPSKAGEHDDDPTVRKTIGFARRWGFGRVVA